MLRDFTIWLANNLEDEDLEILRDEGAVNGVPGMMYYHETEELYKKFNYDMWEAITNYCETTGLTLSDILVNIVGTGCQTHRQFANGLVWFAAEMYAEDAIRLRKQYNDAGM
jgi:hypothetical protein